MQSASTGGVCLRLHITKDKDGINRTTGGVHWFTCSSATVWSLGAYEKD